MVLARLLALAMAMAVPVWPAITLTITNGNGAPAGECWIPSGVRAGPVGYGCVVTLTGTGSWAATRSADYGPSAVVCRITAGSLVSCPDVSSGTDAAELRIYDNLDGTGPYTTNCTTASTLTTCTRSVTINGTTIPVTIKNVERGHAGVYSSANKFTSADHIATGCSSADAYLFPYPNLCPVAAAYPLTAVDLPNPGVGFTDAQFGTKAWVVQVDNHEYSTQWFGSSSGNYMLSFKGGLPGVYPIKGSPTALYNYPGGYFDCQFRPDAAHLARVGLPEITIDCFDSTHIHTFSSRGATPPALHDEGVTWSVPNGEASIQDGGTGHPSSDGWRILYACALSANCGAVQPLAAWHNAYLVNLYNPSQYFYIDLSDARITRSGITGRAVAMLDRNSSGIRYVDIDTERSWLAVKDDGTWSLTSSYVNRPGGPTQWLVATDCQINNLECSGGFSHRTYAQANGNTFIINQNPQEASNYAQGVTTMNPQGGSPTGIGDLFEQGGTAHFVPGIPDHITAAAAPYPLFVSAKEPNSGNCTGNPAMHIRTIAGNPAVATMDSYDTSDYNTLTGLTAGGQIYISCSNDLPGTQDIRGFWTVSAASGVHPNYQVTISGLNYTGSYSGNCAATRRIASADLSPGEVQVVRMNPLGAPLQIQRALKPRNANFCAGFNGGATQYYGSQNHCGITQDGRFIYCDDNNGEPNRVRIISAEVMWQMRSIWPHEFAPGYGARWTATGSGGAINIAAHVPTADNVTCAVSPTSNIPAGSPTVALNGPALDRTATFTGTPGTAYYWQCRSTHDDFASEGVALAR